MTAQPEWQEALFLRLLEAGIRQVAYVPDAGHAHLIRRAHAAPEMSAYPLTTEEEGIAACCGAWLGGQRAVLLLQSSGVGNCVNMLSLVASCRFPLLALVTMRGEWAEFNPWQVPMGRATPATLELMGVSTRRADTAAGVVTEVEAALDDAFTSEQAVAVLLGQRLIGRKRWVK
ncbi:phosphonopyruvate decarboxylase [Roseomonas sp. CCTCC AB2023176]|uniref:phosphonopyruvate decarboxylase n=1 Tax=Roseomonas sp. CCTCC AB2023176 TaxID=3342640 RepID=UPI0035D9C15D